jgi:Leucine-rich repeat (LRR) protein
LLIENNEIENLPASIGKLTYLKVLDIHNNKIEEIPKEIGACVALKKISIKNNNFTALPSSMGSLENLSVMDIEWFKYCLPPIRITDKNGKIKKDSMSP